jgi:type III restriction enzyme
MLYLPYYSQTEVKKVVDEIARDTEGAAVVELATEPTEKNPTVSTDVFNKINGLPKYIKPKQDYPDDVERASDLAERLIDRGIVSVEGDGGTPEDVLRGLLVAEMRRVDGANRKQVDKRVKDLLEIDTHRRDFEYAGAGGDEDEEGDSKSKAVHFRDLDGYFEDAKRRLPGGTGSWYYDALISDGKSGKKAKMRVAAVAEIADIKKLLNTIATGQIGEIQKDFEDRVETFGLSEQFKAIWYPPTKPVDGELVLTNPGRVATQKARKKGTEIEYIDFPLLKKHVWAFEKDGDWLYPGSDNAWEEAALTLELDPKRNVVGWYRNPNSGKAALSVPYYKGSGQKRQLALLHPDFVFVSEVDGELVVDIIDPHLDHGDSRDKWQGLARYAADHSDVVRRAIAVVRIGETDWGLDLAKQSVRDALEDTDEPLEDLFKRIGHRRIAG